MLEIVSVPAIMTAVYVLIEIFKGISRNSERFMRLIPLVSMLLGAIAGVILFYAAPSIITADNVFMALIIGGVSGLGATGCNQAAKQLKKE